jgi:hypothetical protein
MAKGAVEGPEFAKRGIVEAAEALWFSGVHEFTPSDMRVLFSAVQSLKVAAWPKSVQDLPFRYDDRSSDDILPSNLSQRQSKMWQDQWNRLEARFPDDLEEGPRVRLIMVRAQLRERGYAPHRKEWDARRWSRTLTELVANGLLAVHGPPKNPTYSWRGADPQTNLFRAIDQQASAMEQAKRQRPYRPTDDLARTEPFVHGTFLYGLSHRVSEEEHRIVQQLRRTASRLGQIAALLTPAGGIVKTSGDGESLVFRVAEDRFILATIGEPNIDIHDANRPTTLVAAERCLSAIDVARAEFEKALPPVDEELVALMRRHQGIESGWQPPAKDKKKRKKGKGA